MKIVTIGRSSSNDVNINDSLVSRSHCQIIQDDYGNFKLIDTNSRNGIYVNGVKQRHSEIRLSPSDVVRIGNTTLPWQSYFNNVGGTNYDGGRTVAGNSNRNSIYINYGNNGNGADVPPKPSDFMVWAILSTIFCSILFGIISIVYASKVDNLWCAGKYTEAQNAASKARTWFWIAFVFGLLGYIGFAIVILLS